MAAPDSTLNAASDSLTLYNYIGSETWKSADILLRWLAEFITTVLDLSDTTRLHDFRDKHPQCFR